LVVGSFDELAGFEAGSEEGAEVRCVLRAPAGLGGLDELEGRGESGGTGAGALGDLGGAVPNVAKVDSIVIWSRSEGVLHIVDERLGPAFCLVDVVI
jgi:hypothetical protein